MKAGELFRRLRFTNYIFSYFFDLTDLSATRVRAEEGSAQKARCRHAPAARGVD